MIERCPICKGANLKRDDLGLRCPHCSIYVELTPVITVEIRGELAERVERYCERRGLDVEAWLREQIQDRLDFQLGMGDYVRHEI